MLTNTQLISTNNDKEDLSTIVTIPVNSLKNPTEYDNLKVIQNIVIKQFPDGTVCLAEAVEEPLHLIGAVPLKLVNDTTDRPPVRSRTILLNPPRKPVQDKPPLKKLEPKPTSQPYLCIKCNNLYNTITQYRDHLNWHKCQKKFKCTKCCCGYNVENNLKIHMVLMHSEERNMQCPICHISLKFQRVASLKSHLMLHHVEEYYTCDQCNGEFDNEDEFLKHVETHSLKKKSKSKPLTCTICKLEFKDSKEFRAHVADHVKLRKTVMRNRRPRKPGVKKEKSSHVCPMCKRSFIKNSLLERHLRIHRGERPYKCQFCDRTFTQKGTLQIHLSKHTGVKPYACTLCPARFIQKGNLQVHVKKTHTFPAEKDQKMYKCSQCSCIFKKIATLNGHVTKAHLNTKDTSKLDDDLIEDVLSKLKELQRQTSGNPQVRCTEKNKENEPKTHIVIENKPVEVPDFQKKNFINLTESSSDGTVRKYLVRQKKVGEVRWYFCNYCSKQFKKPSDLIRHMRVHTKEKPFKCQQCGSEFTLKSTLLSHVKSHSKMNYSCKVCGCSFVTLRVLNAHLRKHDMEALPKWQCITCDFVFDELEQGIKHRDKMGREKPHVVQPYINHILKQPLYQTTYGSLAFKPPKTRVPNTGSESPTLRPFHCTICDARFTKRINLKRHIQFHNGDRNFKCNLCPKTFITSYRLKEHLNFHNNVKNYACKLCDKKFVTTTLLKRHMIVHNSHRPYQCPYCAKTFKTLLLCRAHITKVHKKEVVSKLNLEQKNLRTQSNLDQKEKAVTEMLPISSENSILQGLPPSSTNENVVIEQLLPQDGSCIQIMNSDGDTTDLTNYPTIYVNMNDFQFLDTTNLNLADTNESELKLQSSDASLINRKENMQVSDIIFDMDSMKPGLSLPPEEIFETSQSENQALQSITEISTKPIKLGGFSEDTTGDKSGNLGLLLNNSANLYTNVNLNNYLNLPINVGEGGTIFDSTGSSSLYQPAAVADLNRVDDIYETTNIICISCSRMFTGLDSFQEHTCISLTEEPVDVESNKEPGKDPNCDNIVENENEEEDQREIFKCEVCNKVFSQKSSFERHLGTHSIKSNIVCSVCKAVVNGRTQYLKHLATHKGPKASLTRSCKFCFKEFKKPSDLNRHLRTHTGEKPFGCHLCGKTFTLKSTLESHIKTHDPTPKQFSCNVCNSFFSSKSSLKVHMTIHTGQRPHSCSFCDQKFRTVGNRKSHEALMHLSKSKKGGHSKHTAIKNVLETVASGIVDNLNETTLNQEPSVQNDTGNTFKTTKMISEVETATVTTENLLSTLQDDQIPIDPVLLLQQLQMSGLILTNENNEPVSTLLLDDGTILNVDGAKDAVPELSLQPVETEAMVTIGSTAVAKMEKVRNLECDICHKMYASKDVLRKHRKKVHGVNKKYPCIKCDRAYDTQDELSKHNKWHAGYRAFSCVYCANSFTEESGLKIHMKRMHQHSNATKTTTSALLDVNFDLTSEGIDDPLLNNLFTFKKIA